MHIFGRFKFTKNQRSTNYFSSATPNTGTNKTERMFPSHSLCLLTTDRPIRRCTRLYRLCMYVSHVKSFLENANGRRCYCSRSIATPVESTEISCFAPRRPPCPPDRSVIRVQQPRVKRVRVICEFCATGPRRRKRLGTRRKASAIPCVCV